MLKIAQDSVSYKGYDHKNDTALYPQPVDAGQSPSSITPGQLLRLSRVKAKVMSESIKNRSEQSVPVAGEFSRSTLALDGVVSGLQQGLR